MTNNIPSGVLRTSKASHESQDQYRRKLPDWVIEELEDFPKRICYVSAYRVYKERGARGFMARSSKLRKELCLEAYGPDHPESQ